MTKGHRPDFRLDAAIIGAQKSATTTLFDRLVQHPDVSGCHPKEPKHFDKPDWREGMADYAALFPEPEGKLTLEASTTSSFARCGDAVAERLHEHNPALRVIYVVRDPIDRIKSAHRHSVDRGYNLSPKLEKALEQWPGLVDNTRYASRLRPYRRLFGADNVLILTFEDITRDQEASMARAQDFLGLRPFQGEELASNKVSDVKLLRAHDKSRVFRKVAQRAPRLYETVFKRGRKTDSAMSPATRDAIRRELAPEVAELERWTGRDLSGWMA